MMCRVAPFLLISCCYFKVSSCVDESRKLKGSSERSVAPKVYVRTIVHPVSFSYVSVGIDTEGEGKTNTAFDEKGSGVNENKEKVQKVDTKSWKIRAVLDGNNAEMNREHYQYEGLRPPTMYSREANSPIKTPKPVMKMPSVKSAYQLNPKVINVRNRSQSRPITFKLPKATLIPPPRLGEERDLGTRTMAERLITPEATNEGIVLAKADQGEENSELSQLTNEKGKDNGKKSESSGSEFASQEQSQNSRKGEKHYKSMQDSEKHGKGSNNKEQHEGQYKQEKGEKKKISHGEGFYIKHEKGEKAKNIKKHQEGKNRKKGHSTHGEHNVVKKDEYIKSTKFYDEEHDDGEDKQAEELDEHHEKKKGENKKANKFKEQYHDEDHVKKGHHAKGHYHDEETNSESEKAKENHYNNGQEQKKNSGSKKQKQWKGEACK